MKDFKKLIIWEKGIEIVKETYSISKLLPSEEKFGLVSQMTRAAVSIPSNIAEGSGRISKKEYFRFIEIALGSTFELETLLVIIDEINLANNINIEKLQKMIIEEQKMLNSFLSVLNN
jgi:four helix bundle protein